MQAEEISKKEKRAPDNKESLSFCFERSGENETQKSYWKGKIC